MSVFSITAIFSIFLLQFLFQLSQSEVEYGYKDYTEFYNGNLNILISVPHDGYMKPSTIKTRTDPDGPIVTDAETRRVGIQLRNNLMQLFSNGSNKVEKPFMVINNLDRTKLDPNRNIGECCANIYDDSYLAYKDYHNFISQKWKLEFLKNSDFRQLLLIDIHGQSHPENWIELGYVLTSRDLNSYKTLRYPEDSSICSMTKTSPYSFDNIIRGDSSLGALLAKNYPDIRVVPSPKNPSPQNGNYYNGGYIVSTHGSLYCNGIVNAIQIESPASVRTERKINEYVKALALSIYQFYMRHYFDD